MPASSAELPRYARRSAPPGGLASRATSGHYALVTDLADRLIATAAKEPLGRLGLVRKGRSRTWIDDHGWWLINIEFTPSSHRPGCYLTVGEQHLWVDRDHLCFETPERPLGGSAFVAFDGDEDAFDKAMAQVVTTAVLAVERRRTTHGDGTVALRRLASGSDDLNGGIAAALLGDTKGVARLGRRVHDVDREVAESYVGRSVSEAREQALAAIARTRHRLRLAATDAVAW